MDNETAMVLNIEILKAATYYQAGQVHFKGLQV